MHLKIYIDICYLLKKRKSMVHCTLYNDEEFKQMGETLK